jgi:hypothetical protein
VDRVRVRGRGRVMVRVRVKVRVRVSIRVIVRDIHSIGYGSFFPAEMYTRGCHWIPHIFA